MISFIFQFATSLPALGTTIKSLKETLPGLERWLGDLKHQLLIQMTQIWFPKPTWWLTLMVSDVT